MGLLLFPASEPMQVDNSSPSEVGVIRKIGFLKNHYVSEPRGLFAFGGKVLTTELTKYLRPFWTRKQIPKNWSE